MNTFTTTTVRMNCFQSGRRDLPATFVPSEDDVLCGKGKGCVNHNKKFRKMVSLYFESYSNATSRVEKSRIVTTIVDGVRSRSTGFVKTDKSTGLWFEVGDHLAREKVGQMLRDALHTQYRSSTKSKKSRRQLEQAKANHTLTEISNTNFEISSTMDDLMDRVSCTNNDRQLSDMFTQANLDILNELNRLNAIRQAAVEPRQ